MDGIFKSISKYAKYVLIGGAGLYVIWHIIYVVANGMGNSFMSVMSSLLRIIVCAAIVGCLVVFLLIDEQKAAKITFCLIGSYWLIASISTSFIEASAITNSSDGLYITGAVFNLLAAICLFGAIVIFFLDLLGIVSLKDIIPLIGLAVIVFLFLTTLFYLIYYGKINDMIRSYGGQPAIKWYAYVNNIINGMIVPSVLFCGYLEFIY